MKRVFLSIFLFLTILPFYAQTQYDYYDDSAVAGGADRALNGIIIIAGIIIGGLVLILTASGVLNIYYWFNPQANPDYKRAKEKREREEKEKRKIEEFVSEQRQKATLQYVDLGLSVKWASFNLGAYKPSDVGSTFYWADNQPSTKGYPMYRKINNVSVIGDIGGNEKYDAATKKHGSNWRMPTEKECQELLEQCKWETKIIDGMEGRLITGLNGNSIFLPFNQKSYITGKYVSGHYWTSSPHMGTEGSAKDLRFGENCREPAEIWSATVYSCLFCIRPVFSTITREMNDKLEQAKTKDAYAKIFSSNIDISNIDYIYYQEQCNLHEREKTYIDEHGVVYSIDGQKLLDGRNCDCKIYEIREGTKFICHNAFTTSLFGRRLIIEKIILPSSLVFIPRSAIPYNCSIESKSPSYVIINNLLIDIRKKSIVKCLNRYIQHVEIYEPIEEIGDYAFANCEALHSVLLPNSIKIIGRHAFRNCEILTNFTLPNSVYIISDEAFWNCKNLCINSLPKKISILGNFVFQWCTIDGIIIPDCLEKIGTKPFSNNCKNVTSYSKRFIIYNSLLIDSTKKEVIQLVDTTKKNISIPNYITKIGTEAFGYTDITNIRIPSSVIEIGEKLFNGCRYLIDIQLDCQIDRIPELTFARCSSLTSFNLPDCIKIIEKEAFYSCENLIEVTLNQNLQIIENLAFDSCSNLRVITILSKNIKNDFGWINKCNNLQLIRVHADIYNQIAKFLPKRKNLKIKKIKKI